MLKTSAQLRLENLALREQLTVLRRSAPKRLKLTPADRIFSVLVATRVERLEARPDDGKVKRLSPGIDSASAFGIATKKLS